LRQRRHEERMEQKYIQNFGVKSGGKEHLEELRVGGRIISKSLLNKHNGSVWHRIGTGPS
jgi:hypothetical protein